MLGADSDYTCLVWTLPEGEDPDSAYSSVPYEKVSDDDDGGGGGGDYSYSEFMTID